ncbi:MAG: M14 family zinc carboxypeptidase [Acutalibacteraceae bacterium]
MSNKTMKTLLCCILAAFMAASSMAIVTALDGAEENEIEVQIQTEVKTQTEADSGGKYILGDVTSDGNVNLLDAIAIQKLSLSMIDLTEIQKQCGDVDKNETVNLLDSIMIQKYVLGMLGQESQVGKYFTPAIPTDPETTPTQPQTQPTAPETTPTEPITVPKDPTDPDTVELNKTSLTIGVGEKYTLEKSSPTGSDISNAVFTSNNPDVVKVDASTGEVTGLKVGGAVITITTRNGATAFCSIAVKKAPTTMSLNKTSLTLGVGEKYDLDSSLGTGEGAYSILYSSSNTSIVSVKAAGGIVTANNVGNAIVTATAYNGKKVSCNITVKNAPTSVSLNKTKLTMTVGSTFDLNSSLPSGQAAHSIVYSSNNTKVADVKVAGGIVTANYPGTATITATTYNGKKVNCVVNVPVINFNVNHTSKMVRDEINCLSKMYPELLKVSSVGKSIKGKDISLVKMGFGSKKGFIYAGCHSREDLAVNFTLRSIAEYAKTYYSSSGMLGSYNIKSLLNKYTLYIIPCCNPDGLDICNSGENPTFNFPNLVRGQYKGNARNVNINRNFPYGWYDSRSGEKNSISNKGTNPGSEPETQAIMNLCKSNKFEWGIDIHILSGGIYWRANHTGVIPNDYSFASKVSNSSGLPLFDAGYDEANYGGTFSNWFRDYFKKPAICVELVPMSKVLSWNDYRLHTQKFEYCSDWSNTKYLFAGAMLY